MLTFSTLGGLQIYCNEQPLPFAARRAELLLTYLAMTQRVHEREAIANMLWDDRTQKQTMANLRSMLAQMPPEVKPFVITTRKTIAVSADVWVDALAFETDQNLELYKGAFLDGVFITGSHGLEEWIAITRERLRQQAFIAHEAAARAALYQREYATGIAHARELVKIDPLMEGAWRLLLRLLVRNGQTNEALVRYHELAKILNTELGVSPAAETARLAQLIHAVRERVPSQLPAQFTAFIGRKNELQQIAERMDDPACRLLTLHGVGGIGKTRLALEAASFLQADFMHGVHFVSLATAYNGERALLRIANQLALPLDKEQPVIEQLITFLGEKELLLVLDNAEHLVAALQPQLDRLLRRLPLLRLIVTSRTQLDLAAEWVLPLDGLRREDEAIELFVTTVQRHRPNFAITQENRSAVDKICALLQGLPLGIELAAATGKSVRETAHAISENLAALQTSSYGIPDRQRSLGAAFEYSWVLLNDDEQALLAQLSVFQAGFTQAAAAAVTQKADWLANLRRKALVQVQGEDRHALHPAIRQFAATKLTTTDATRLRHSRYYGQLSAELGEQLKDARQLSALQVTESAEANLEHGWQFAVQQADWPLIDQYLFALHKHFETKSRYLQAVGLFGSALRQVRQVEPVDQHVLGRILTYYGFHLERVGDYAEANAAFDEAIGYFEETDSADMLLTIMGHRGMIAYNRGELTTAQTIYRQTVSLAQRYEDGRALAHCLSHLGYVESALGDVESAETAFQQSIDIWREIGTPRGLVIALNGLAVLHQAQGKLAEAKAVFAENLTVCELAGDAMGEARTLQNLANIARQEDDIATAQAHLERAIAINHERINNQWLDSFLTSHLADVYLQNAQLAEAERLYQHALAICLEEADQRGEAVARLGIGRIAIQRMQLTTAKTELQRALHHTHTTNWLPMLLNVLVQMAHLAFALGDKKLAAQTITFALAHAATTQPAQREATALAAKLDDMTAHAAAPDLSTLVAAYQRL